MKKTRIARVGRISGKPAGRYQDSDANKELAEYRARIAETYQWYLDKDVRAAPLVARSAEIDELVNKARKSPRCRSIQPETIFQCAYLVVQAHDAHLSLHQHDGRRFLAARAARAFRIPIKRIPECKQLLNDLNMSVKGIINRVKEFENNAAPKLNRLPQYHQRSFAGLLQIINIQLEKLIRLTKGTGFSTKYQHPRPPTVQHLVLSSWDRDVRAENRMDDFFALATCWGLTKANDRDGFVRAIHRTRSKKTGKHGRSL